MKRIDRRTFVFLSSVGASGAVLSACGNTESTDAELNPTIIPDVAGAPPTLAPVATPGGGAQPAEEEAQEDPALEQSGEQEPAEQAPAEEAPAEGGQAAGGGAGEPFVLEGYDPAEWSVYEFEVAPGQIIQVTNTGVLQHTFAVDEWGLDEELPNGEPVDIPVPEDAEVGASLEYYCSIPGHREQGMVGTLTVIEAAAGAAAESVPAGGAQAAAPAGGEQAAATPPPAEQAAATPPPAAEQAPAAATPAATAPPAQVAPAPAQATPVPGTISLYAQDPNVWNPNQLTVSAGDMLSVINTGVLPHDFTVDEWGVSQYLPNGGLVEIQVPDTVQSGQSFRFYSSEEADQGMEGTITIR
jgi:plastocyanin